MTSLTATEATTVERAMGDADVSIRLLGGLEVRVCGGPPRRWSSGRARALLAFLVLADRPVAREEAQDALWPHLGAAQARNNLNVTVCRLRETLHPVGRTLVVGGRAHLELSSVGTVDIDVARFERDVVAARAAESSGDVSHALTRYEAALGHYGGELVPEEPYLEWLDRPRARVRRTYLAAVARIRELRELQGDHRRAAWASELALELDEFDEDAMARWVRCTSAVGDVRRATVEVARYRERLAAALGVSPGPRLAAAIDGLTVL